MIEHFVTREFLDDIFINNDTDKFYDIITKNNKYDLCNIFIWCTKYQNSNFDKILFNAIDDKLIIIDDYILENCIKISYYKLVEFIIEQKFDIEKYSKLFIWSCYYNNIEFVRLLLDHNVDVNYCNSISLLSIYYPQSIEILKLLLDHNLDVNYDNCILFVKVCESGSVEVLKLLLDNGLRLDYNNPNIETGIKNIIKKRKVEMINFLVNYGFDFYFLNNIVHDNKNDKEIINILQAQGINISKIYDLLF
ncbi:repeat protein [Moumouvirus goulette]|uniref:Repeat protein n=1 Tax=Moumouvirus goulette TaxID=1247379 RepID=M1PCM3_9VIRU|nr:repeat protein [Moumouvirus goulette]AGF85749.1 repeat protein [Moumouvirus goulette]